MSERVIAVSHTDADSIYIFGRGTLVGREVPDESAVGAFADFLRHRNEKNPKILLDNGSVVWGCECWWGPEADEATFIGGRRVVEVSIKAARAEYGQ